MNRKRWRASSLMAILSSAKSFAPPASRRYLRRGATGMVPPSQNLTSSSWISVDAVARSKSQVVAAKRESSPESLSQRLRSANCGLVVLKRVTAISRSASPTTFSHTRLSTAAR